MRTLQRLAREAARSTSADTIRATLGETLRDLLSASTVRLLDVTQDGSGVSSPGTDAYLRFTTGEPGGTARAVATQLPVALADTRRCPETDDDTASALFIPVILDDEVRTVAVAGWHEPHEPSEEDIAAAQAAADVAAGGLARLESEQRRAAATIHDRAVVRAGRALNASLNLQEILLTLVHEAALALHADFAGVYLGNAADGAIATAGYGVPDGWHNATIQAGDGIAGRVLASSRTEVCHDYRHVLGAPDVPMQTALAVPMVWSDELRGVLSIGWEGPHRLDDDTRDTLDAIAGLATAACRNAEAYEQVQHAARTDALTGVLNHGAMQLRIREEIARARRDGTPLGAVILDLDDFKGVNDTRGHAAGDELLRRVARKLQVELRPYDQVARYGGDEFVLLLPGSDEATAAAVAERCRDAIGGNCSIGVAAWHDGLDADALLEHADRALMLAKRTGKGRVAIANAEVERELALLQSSQGSPAAVQALAAAIEERDNYTRAHSDEVVRLSRGVAMMLGLPSDDVDRVAHAALLHDVGKLGIPAELLEKEGPLTAEEWAVMSEHPIVGERILARTKELAAIAPVVRHEHEHWDGSGYPDGLEGHRIPIGSRVILAAHAYVAMTTPRPYRGALPAPVAVAELCNGIGTKYDPEVIEALLDLLGHNAPNVPDRAEGVKLVAPTPREPTSERSRPKWAPGASPASPST